jgi:hypothetical protein
MPQPTERSILVEEANTLGLSFQSNIQTTKLKNLVDEAKGVISPDETLASSAPAKAETKKDTVLSSRQKIAVAKKEAFLTKVVTITNKDVREADMVTTAHLSFENNFFGMAKNVPLDIPVELEVSLIKIANSAMMTLHKDEIIDGKRTGNKVATRVKKYAISYGESE